MTINLLSQNAVIVIKGLLFLYIYNRLRWNAILHLLRHIINNLPVLPCDTECFIFINTKWAKCIVIMNLNLFILPYQFKIYFYFYFNVAATSFKYISRFVRVLFKNEDWIDILRIKVWSGHKCFMTNKTHWCNFIASKFEWCLSYFLYWL